MLYVTRQTFILIYNFSQGIIEYKKDQKLNSFIFQSQ